MEETHDQVHENRDPLNGGVIVLLDVGQERSDCELIRIVGAITRVVVPMEKDERTLLQQNHIRVHKLIELQEVVHVVQHVQRGVVVRL